MATLIQQLLKKKILDSQKATSLDYEVKTSGRKEEEILLERRVVSESFLFNLKSRNINIPLKKIVPEDIDLKTLELIAEDSAKYYQMVPLRKQDGLVEVGMVYPEDLRAQEALKFLARRGNFSYQVFLITLSDYQAVFKRYRSLKREVEGALEELELEMKEDDRAVRLSDLANLSGQKRLTEEKPISRMVTVILRHAVEGNASDIHIEPTRDRLRVRFRIMGILYSSIFLPLNYLPSIVARVKILASLRIDETRMPQDGRFSIKIDNKKIDFRVSTFPVALGEKVAIRILDPDSGPKSIDGLGLQKQNAKIIQEAIKKPSGLVLVVGPTGCGKTTTLYTVLRALNKEGVNIVTLEDPVEYFLEGINQSQIKPEIGYTFARGLRHVLRQDPDIVMVGEIRDSESANLAINAALTGHLVLSTLHTNNAAGVIPRLLDLAIEPYLIPPALSVSISQRLVRTLCPKCKKKVKATGKIKEILKEETNKLPQNCKEEIATMKSFYVWEAVGCKKCKNLGFVGRVGIFEVLEMTDRLAGVIAEEPSETEIDKEAIKQGMLTMKQDGILKALAGITTVEEVLRVAEEK